MQAYQCGKCKKAYGDKEVAEKCCEPTYCPKCGIEKPSYYVHCEKCRLENQYNSGNKIPYLKYKIDKMYDERRNKYYSDYEEMFEDYSENILSDEDVGRALKRMKKILDKEGLMKQLRANRYFEKPSEKQRRKSARARARARARRSANP